MGYSNGQLESEVKGGKGERGEQGLPGIGFKLTDNGNFDIDGKRLTDVSQPVDGGDATTKAYVDREIGHYTVNFYHLRQSFTFYDSSDTELALSTDSIAGLVTDYKHGYSKIRKGGDETTYSYVSIKIRNNLPKSYVNGEIAKVHIDTTPLLPRDGSRSMFDDLDMGRNHILSLENLNDHKVDDAYENIVRDLRSVVNKEYLNEQFLKRDKNDNYFDLRQKIVRNCEPYYQGLFSDNDLVSKAFVDTEIAKLPKPDTDVLKLDGSKAMTDNLDIGDHTFVGIRSSSQDNAALTVGGAKATYFPLLGELKSLIKDVSSNALNRKKPKSHGRQY